MTAHFKQRVVIIGSGWAGFNVAYALNLGEYEVTVVSPQSTSPYTPLLASAACGLFDFRLAEEPIRRKGRKIQYVKAAVLAVDFAAQKLRCEPAFLHLKDEVFDTEYDILVVAPGCATNTFGTPGVEKHAIFMKNVSDAMAVRNRLGDILEMASLPSTPSERQQELLHVAIVGGGPTGIEIAAELTDLFHNDLAKIYPHLAHKMSITVHDVAPQILVPFEKKLSEYATSSLMDHRVEIKVDSHITDVTQNHIVTKEDGQIPYGMLIWATGNKHVPLLDTLEVAKSDYGLKRILTDSFLRVRRPDGTIISGVYALGDAGDIDGSTLPTTAEVAVQKADYLVKALNNPDAPKQPFKYQQRAMVTYTGQNDGVVQGKHDFSGYTAWLSWRAGNIFWTRSWRRRFIMLMHWLGNWLDGREIARN